MLTPLGQRCDDSTEREDGHERVKETVVRPELRF
ncbi:hypothetical protein CAEBREN_31611 [Caenorhabditis brenneri]|uniref:Uncharacterized protein n=1 Tax=Caenorhabditis brenneri TaxID=135651 RepID=G0NWB8_CAEBE|nr:hypothetical protein CAEBREN_31611 [Caenorhabditis brenneri]